MDALTFGVTDEDVGRDIEGRSKADFDEDLCAEFGVASWLTFRGGGGRGHPIKSAND